MASNEADEGPVLRMMTAPNGQWPQPVDLGNHRCRINYNSTVAGAYSRTIIMRRMRQAERTPLIEATCELKGPGREFRLNRITHIFGPDEIGEDPITYVQRHFGITCMEVPTARSSPPPAGPLLGLRVTFTGAFERYSRATTKGMVESLGGMPVGGAINDTVNLLVVGTGDTVSAAKIKAASKLGIETIDEAEFLKRIGWHP